jgi:hypothetical protein
MSERLENPHGPTIAARSAGDPVRAVCARFLLATIVMAGVTGMKGMAQEKMMDLSIEDGNREWCYLAKSTTVIGAPFQPDVTQVAFDGALFTGNAELCLFYGTPLRPLLARQKTFLEGWIPVVQYDWEDGAIAYDLEMFAASLEDGDSSNALNFVRVAMRNAGGEATTGALVAALRHTGKDYRFGGSEFSPLWTYEMTGDCAVRDGKLMYTFSPEAAREAVPGAPYRGPFMGKERHVTDRSEVCLARYERRLAPGETVTMTFKMPRVPVDVNDRERVAKVRGADYDAHRRKTVEFWRGLWEGGATFSIPEKRVQDAQRASLVHLSLATRERDGMRFQTSGLPYPDFFMIDFIDMRMAYDVHGWRDLARTSFQQIFKQQMDDGLFCDTSLSHGERLWSSHGHMLHTLAHHCLFTRDWNYGREIYPSIRRAVEWIERARTEDEYGLMPPTYPYDAEMIDGHYTSHNLWCLLGLRSAIRLARALNEKDDAAAWLKLHDDYLASFMKALEATSGDAGYAPPGLYKYLTGKAARRGFNECQTNCDWENMLLVYPTEVLEPGDPRVRATLDKVRRGYAEGVMTYRHGQHLHQYVTTNLIEQYLAIGDAKQALTDFYHVLLHCGSTHEGFENLVRPWTDRAVSPDCPPPHAWAAAKIALLIRNMLILEHGGRAGLDPGERDLYLFPAVSPAWALAGKELSFRNAPTDMGRISAAMRFSKEGANVTIQSDFHTPPANLKIRIPYFKADAQFQTDARKSELADGCIVLSPDATRVEIRWRDRTDAHRGTFEDLLRAYRASNAFKGVDEKGAAIVEAGKGFILESEKRTTPQPLSLELVKEAFLHECRRRVQESVARGGGLVRVEAPPMLTARERRDAFVKQYGE